MLPRIQGGDSRPFDERVSKETREFIRAVNRNPNVLHLPSQLPSTSNRQQIQRIKTRPSRPGTSGVALLPSNHYSSNTDRVLDGDELQGLLQQADQLQGVCHAEKMRPCRSRAAPRVSPPASHQSLRPTSKPTPPTTLPSLPLPASAPAHLFQLLNADKYAPRRVLSKYRAQALERAVSKRSGVNARVDAHVEEIEQVIERILPQNAIGAQEEVAVRVWASHAGSNSANAHGSRGSSAGWSDRMAEPEMRVEGPEWGMTSRHASSAEVREGVGGGEHMWSSARSTSPHSYNDASVLDNAQGAGGWSQGEWVTVPATTTAGVRAGSAGAPVSVPMSRTAAYMSEFLMHGPQSPHALLWGDTHTGTGTGAWSREAGDYRVTNSAVGVRVVCARGSDAERRRLNTTLGGQLAAVELHTLRRAFESGKKNVKTLPTAPVKERNRGGGMPHTQALRTLDELAAEISRNERSGISGVRNPNLSENLAETENTDPAQADNGVSEKSASESGSKESRSAISHLLSDIGARLTQDAPAHAHIPLRLRDAPTHTRAQVPPMVHTYAARATAPVDAAVCVEETLRGSAVDAEVCDGRLRLKLTITQPPVQPNVAMGADAARANAADTATFLTATDVGTLRSTPSTAADEESSGTGAFSSSSLSSSTTLTSSPSTPAALVPQQLGMRRMHAPMPVTAHTLTAGAYYPSRRVVHIAGASKGVIAGESSLLTQTTQPVRWAHDSYTHSKARKHSELIHKQPTRSKLLGLESKHTLGKNGASSEKCENFGTSASESDSTSVSSGDLVITTDLLTSSLAVQPIDTFLHRAQAAARSLAPRAEGDAGTRTLMGTRSLTGTQRSPPAIGGVLSRAASTRLPRTRTGTTASHVDLRSKRGTSLLASSSTSSSSSASSSSSKLSPSLFLSPLPADPLARARWLCALLAALPPRITETSLESIFPGLSPHARAAKARKLHALRQHLRLARSQASVPAWLWRNPRFRAALSLSSTALAASAMQVDAAERSELVVRRAVDWLCTHTPLLQLRTPANAAGRAGPTRSSRVQSRGAADAPRQAYASDALTGPRSAAADASAAAGTAPTSMLASLSGPSHPPPRGSATPRPSTHAYAQRPRVPTQRLSVHSPATQRSLPVTTTQRARGPAQAPPRSSPHPHSHTNESTAATAPAVHASLFSAVASFLQLAHRGHPMLPPARMVHAEQQGPGKDALVTGGTSLDLSSMALALTRTRTHTQMHNILHAPNGGSGNCSSTSTSGDGADGAEGGGVVADKTVEAGKRAGTGTGTNAGSGLTVTAANALAFLTSAHGHAHASLGADAAADADMIDIDTASCLGTSMETDATRAGAQGRERRANNGNSSGSGAARTTPSPTATATLTSTPALSAPLSPVLHAISTALAPFAQPSRNTWLASLSPALFRTIIRTATVATYRPGDVVYACGAAAGDIFLVLSGALVRRVGHTPAYVARYHGPGVSTAVDTSTAVPAEARAYAEATSASQYCSCPPVDAWAPAAVACANAACCLCCSPAGAPLPLLVPAYAVAHAAQLGGVVAAHASPPAVASRATVGGRGGIAGSGVGCVGQSSLLPLGPAFTPSIDSDGAHSHALTCAPTQCPRVDTTAFTFLPFNTLSSCLLPLYPPPALSLTKQPPAYASPYPLYLPVLPGATFGHEPLVRLYTCIQRAERKAFVQSLWRLLRLSVRAAGVLRRRREENGALVYFSKHNNTYLPVFQKERARERGRRVKAFASVVAIGAECQRLLAPTDAQRQRHARQEGMTSVPGPAISARAQPTPRVPLSCDLSNTPMSNTTAAAAAVSAAGTGAEDGLTLRCIMQAAALVRPQRGEAEVEADEFNGISGYLSSHDAPAGSDGRKALDDAHTQAQMHVTGRTGVGARGLIDGRAAAHALQGHCAHCGQPKALGTAAVETSASPPNLVSHSRQAVTEYSSPSSAHVLHRLDTVIAAAESVVVRISYLAFDTAILAHKRINVHAASLFLGTVPLFSRFSSSRLRRLHSVARIKAVLPGECVFRQGDPADMLAVVCQGRVALQRHCQVTHARKWPAAKAVWECEEYTSLHSVTVDEIGPRGTCGAEVLLGCSHYDFTVVALPPQRAEGAKAVTDSTGTSSSNGNGSGSSSGDDMELHSNVFINLDDPSLVCPSLSPAPAATPSHARVVVLLIPARHLHYLSPLFPHMAADAVEHLRIKAALLTQKSLVQAFPKSHQRQPFPVCVWSKGTARADAALMHYSIDSLRSHAFVQAATLVRQYPHRSNLNHSGAGLHGTAQRGHADVAHANSLHADGGADSTKTAASATPSAPVSLHGCVRVVCAQPQALETTGLVVRYDPPFTQLFPKAATHSHCTCRQKGSGKGGEGSSATVAPYAIDNSPQAVAAAPHTPLPHALHRCPHQTHAPCRGACECVIGESVRVGWVAAEDNVLVTEPIKVSYVVKAGKTRSYRGAAQ